MTSTMRFDRWEDSTGALIAEGSAPRGIVTTTAGGTNGRGYFKLASNFSTSSTTPVDVTGATITFNMVAGRLYKISASAYLDHSASNGRFALNFCDASNTVIRTWQDQANATWNRISASNWFYVTGTGSQTVKLRLSAVDAGQTVYLYGSQADGTYFVIEDIGPA